MYNSVTEQNIEAAPELDGLDQSHLATMLADAFAQITSLKVSLSEGARSQELEALLNDLMRIAVTYESLFLSGSLKGAQIGQAGFVAATAYSLHYQYAGMSKDALFSNETISPVISSVLLFISSGYYADAYEVAKRYQLQDDASYLDSILGAVILGLAQLKLPLEVPELDSDQFGDYQQYAVALLYFQCCSAAQMAAESLLSGENDGFNRCFSKLNEVKKLCFHEFEYGEDAAKSIYQGPLQLAKLLDASVSTLAEGSIFNVSAPVPVEPDKWLSFLMKFAPSRSVLWKQHLDVIAGGFLNTGTSSVLSLPTGAGKTSLAELKIASCLMLSKKVIFIAPTHALEAQVQKRMAEVFGNDVRHVAGDFSEYDQLGKITICTPEACLTLLSLSPEIFSDVGLIVFDECHILNAPNIEHAKRSIDSMFCLLESFEVQPNADYLLMSAMVKNASELASWLSEVTGRPAYAFKDEWKPTRQLRGCVIYSKRRIDELKLLLSQKFDQTTTQGPPVALLRELTVTPYAFFCLKNSWTSSRLDYASLPVLDAPVVLSAGGKRNNNGRWWLSSNRNEVAAAIGGKFKSVGVKTLIFCTEVRNTSSIVDKLEIDTDFEIALTDEEERLLSQLQTEFGTSDKLFFNKSSSAGVHHGLLLKEERVLIESLFGRDSGLDMLVATPTLAQGLNLPAEVIIIAGDDRYDAAAENPSVRQKMEAHELLNAAGRAGRAGHFSQGIVLVIPGIPIVFDEKKGRITNRWNDLKDDVFGKTDQCVDVKDPLSLVFSNVEAKLLDDPSVQSALQRLYPSSGSSLDFKRKVNRTLWAKSLDLAERERAMNVLDAIIGAIDRPDAEYTEELLLLAEKTGVNIRLLQCVLMQLIEQRTEEGELGVVDWVNWVIDLPIFFSLIMLETSQKLEQRINGNDTQERMITLKHIVAAWMAGQPLEFLENLFPDCRQSVQLKQKCTRAREVVLRLIPDVAYVVGIIRSLYPIVFQDEEVPLALQVAQRCVRLGVDSPEKLAFYHINKYKTMRVQLHQDYAKISNLVNTDRTESFSEILSGVNVAIKLGCK